MEQQPASKQAIASQSVEMKQQAMMKQQALRMLETYFGYTSFRPAQEAPIASLLRNEDVIGIMPTGAGKSICFPTNLSYERSSGWSISTEYSGGAHQ